MRYEELTIEGRNAVLEAFRSGCKNCCLACDSEQLFGYLLKGIKGEPINMILSMSKL